MSLIYLQLNEREEEVLERMILLFLEESYSPFDIPIANLLLAQINQQRKIRNKIAADREASFNSK